MYFLFVIFIWRPYLNMNNSPFLRHNVNMGWASAYGRYSLLSPLLSLTKFNMHKPLTNTAVNKMDFYWFLKNKGIIIIAWRNVAAEIMLACQTDFRGSAKQYIWKDKMWFYAWHSVFPPHCNNKLIFLWGPFFLKALCFHKDIIMVNIFILPSTNYFPLLSHCCCPHFYIKPNIYS